MTTDPSTHDPATLYRRAGYRATGLWTDDTLAGLVPGAAARHPDRELFLFEGRRVSYGEFDRWTRAVAADLVTRGVRRGDRVLVQLPNCLEALVLQVAAFRAGAVDVPVVPIYRQHEMRQILADARPAVVCSVAAMGDRAPAEEIDTLLDELGQRPLVRYVVGGERPGWDAVPEAADTDVALPEPGTPDEPALLLYTSGTTSAPKGALLSARAVFAHMVNFKDILGAGEDTVTLAATPLSHLGGFVAAVVFPAFLGGRSVIMPGWRPDEAMQVIEDEKVTLMMGATVFLADMVARYETAPPGEHRLGIYAAAGAAVAPELIDRASAVGLQVARAYGMTETAGVCAAASSRDPLERRRAWDGRLLRGMEIQVVDDERNLVPPGTVGQFRIRGPQMLTGYTDPALTAEQIDADGWFYPGDAGRVDADGWVQMVGRTKDIVNRGGEKFSTMDIEMAIASHPGVARVAVTAVAEERLGEAVGAWVVLDDATRAGGAEPLVEHLHTRGLAKQKIPTQWHVVAEIPATASGKIQKHRLAALDDIESWDTAPTRTNERSSA
ncbi:cyclohexanecarboxylate-CoA ligase/acyl-CoA synthetase [Pseudonocardia sediminis]|uniref:Cyclohexanecarboxylate-CoA ligase/acyl-CoA synthetase n=1 Tax=Pseudonocardia sediminis TaxID=1397368 RepID=A0A4Q7UXQ5_PSEST|nr:class I adenylate-forming enzyme family protein [Pseudonocardia sediminis]RZT84983.1 cyclohexanecarboxylate-CoA ligase/acyl-CoA synthetase [Pseudonocardia sediminis]